MRKSVSLIMALPLCVVLAQRTRAESADVLTIEEDAIVKIVLTKVAVNDQNLELGWKIINNTDHDVWICDRYVDRFMDTDNVTLVLRRRFNLSNEGVIWEFPFPRFRYSRLRPGQEKVDSLSFTMPVEPSALFKTSRGNAEYAIRLALEVGFYEEDLQALILDIVNIAERLKCDDSAISPWETSSTLGLYYRFFGGVKIAQFFNSESFTYFRDSVTSGGDEIIAPYLFQSLNGERTLRIEIENVSIPYKSTYPPLSSHEVKSTEPQQSQDANCSGKNKPAQEKS